MQNANNHMVQSVPWLQRTINTIPFHTGNELSIFSVIGLSNVTEWFPEYCASCKLHVLVTHSAQRLYTGCPRMHKHSNYPLIGTTTHPSMSKPPALLYWQHRTGETTAANHQTQGRPYNAQRPTDHECAPLRKESARTHEEAFTGRFHCYVSQSCYCYVYMHIYNAFKVL